MPVLANGWNVTAAQKVTLDTLLAQGFAVVECSGNAVRVSRNGDNRLVQADGTQKRGHHQVVVTGGGKRRS